MAHSLKSTAQEFFDECPRFRILTTGKTGVGKTTLIKYAFNVNHLQCSDTVPGKCNINEEIYSTENDRFVLHDSQGFEPGETENLNLVKNFILERAQNPDIKEQLHAIWLCFRIPEAGGRLIERGDEMLLELDFGDVPVIVVFTQYDKLYDSINYNLPPEVDSLDDAQLKSIIEQKADEYFNKECVDRLKKLTRLPKKLNWVKVSKEDEYRHTFVDLVQTTYELVRNHVAESVWVASAAAQRVNVNLNVESSISVGMKKYWRGLASSAHFPGNTLRHCLGIIHDDIVKIWNFLDPDMVLGGTAFKAMVLGIVQDLADPDATNPNSGFKGNLESIKAALDVATPISGPVAPVVATVGLSVTFVNWLFGVYNNTPGTLRSLMGYIVDLTIVLEVLFWLKVAQPRNRSVSEDDIEAAFNAYNYSEVRVKVHREIRGYVDKMSLFDHAHPDNAHDEVQRLIMSHSLGPEFIGGDRRSGTS